MELKICHLYPDVLNLYGDTGNVICMKNRLQWRGIDVSVANAPIGETLSFSEFDVFFLGGGQDFEQEVLLDDLHMGKDKNLISAIEDGKTFLAICGGYQMLGNYYQNAAGHRCEFLGAIDFYTRSAEKRMIGNYLFRCVPSCGGSEVVGFENHSGKTYLSNALCIAALRQLKVVQYIKARVMMRELEQARKKDTYTEYLEEKLALDLLVIDDFALMELISTNAEICLK